MPACLYIINGRHIDKMMALSSFTRDWPGLKHKLPAFQIKVSIQLSDSKNLSTFISVHICVFSQHWPKETEVFLSKGCEYLYGICRTVVHQKS